MKRLVIAIIGILALVSVGIAAEIYPAPERTADALIKSSGPGTYAGMIVITDGTNSCTVKVYDSTTASGRVLDDGVCTGYLVSGQNNTCKYLFPVPISFDYGVYADITTAGNCTYMIFTNK